MWVKEEKVKEKVTRLQEHKLDINKNTDSPTVIMNVILNATTILIRVMSQAMSKILDKKPFYKKRLISERFISKSKARITSRVNLIRYIPYLSIIQSFSFS